MFLISHTHSTTQLKTVCLGGEAEEICIKWKTEQTSSEKE